MHNGTALNLQSIDFLQHIVPAVVFYISLSSQRSISSRPSSVRGKSFSSSMVLFSAADGAELVWQNADGTLFEISGKCEEAVLLYAAESIQRK